MRTVINDKELDPATIKKLTPGMQAMFQKAHNDNEKAGVSNIVQAIGNGAEDRVREDKTLTKSYFR